MFQEYYQIASVYEVTQCWWHGIVVQRNKTKEFRVSHANAAGKLSRLTLGKLSKD